MHVYYRPSDGQIMGVYTDVPRSQAFEGAGYRLAKVADGIRPTRDHAATVVDGVVISVTTRANDVRRVQSEEEKRQAAVNALLDELITKRAKDADAPQAIKDAAR